MFNPTMIFVNQKVDFVGLQFDGNSVISLADDGADPFYSGRNLSTKIGARLLSVLSVRVMVTRLSIIFLLAVSVRLLISDIGPPTAQSETCRRTANQSFDEHIAHSGHGEIFQGLASSRSVGSGQDLRRRFLQASGRQRADAKQRAIRMTVIRVIDSFIKI